MAEEQSENTVDPGENVPEDGTPPVGETPTPELPAEPVEPRPGVLIPLALVIVELLFMLYYTKTSTTPFRTYMGIGVVPIVCTLGMLLWWLSSRTVPWRQRFVGLGLGLAAVALPILVSRPFAVFLLVYVLPSITTLLTVALLATYRCAWAERRRVLLMTLAFGSIFFCFTRVAGVDGNMAPLIAWRWAGPPELAGDRPGQGNKTATLAQTPEPEDWPAFRGSRRDGRNMVTRFGVDWAAQPPKELWRRPVGLGWSSFAVVGDYCFTQEQRGPEETVACYETATGNEVWSNRIQERFDDVMGSGPRATPSYDKGKLYTQGATGILQCIDAANGTSLWKRDLRVDAGVKMPQWGFSSSPLVAGDLVVVYTGAGNGKSVLAYNKESGEPVWTAGQGRNGYSSPHWAEVALTPQILQISDYGIEAFEPATGKLLWEDKWELKNNPRVAQPCIEDFYTLVAGTGQGKGARKIKVVKEGDVFVPKILWTSEGFRPYFNDYVFHDGYLYGFDGNRFACMDMTTGFMRWTGEHLGGQILALHAMDTLLLLTEEGEVRLVAAYPAKIEVKASLKALSSKTWNHPVVSRNKLFVRNDREAVCYELPPAPPKEEKPKVGAGH